MAKRKKSSGSRGYSARGGLRRKSYGRKTRGRSGGRKSGGGRASQTVKIVVETVAARDQSPLTATQALAKPAPAPRARQF